MFSFFKTNKTKKTKNQEKESEKEILARIAKESRQRRVNEAERKAFLAYQTIPELIKNANVNYARKKGVLEKYGVGPLPYLSLAKYKEFEQELKNLRAANARNAAEQKRLNNEAYASKMKEFEQEINNYRRASTASDPLPPSRPSSPFGGKRRTRKYRKSRKHQKATRRR